MEIKEQKGISPDELMEAMRDRLPVKHNGLLVEVSAVDLEDGTARISWLSRGDGSGEWVDFGALDVASAEESAHYTSTREARGAIVDRVKETAREAYAKMPRVRYTKGRELGFPEGDYRLAAIFPEGNGLLVGLDEQGDACFYDICHIGHLTLI